MLPLLIAGYGIYLSISICKVCVLYSEAAESKKKRTLRQTERRAANSERTSAHVHKLASTQAGSGLGRGVQHAQRRRGPNARETESAKNTRHDTGGVVRVRRPCGVVNFTRVESPRPRPGAVLPGPRSSAAPRAPPRPRPGPRPLASIGWYKPKHSKASFSLDVPCNQLQNSIASIRISAVSQLGDTAWPKPSTLRHCRGSFSAAAASAAKLQARPDLNLARLAEAPRKRRAPLQLGVGRGLRLAAKCRARKRPAEEVCGRGHYPHQPGLPTRRKCGKL